MWAAPHRLHLFCRRRPRLLCQHRLSPGSASFDRGLHCSGRERPTVGSVAEGPGERDVAARRPKEGLAATSALSQMRGDDTKYCCPYSPSERISPELPWRSRSTPMHRPILQEWTACLGHASIAAAVGAAEKSFSAWKALAEEALAKARKAARSGAGGGERLGEGADGADGGVSSCEAAARDLAECCEVSGGERGQKA